MDDLLPDLSGDENDHDEDGIQSSSHCWFQIASSMRCFAMIIKILGIRPLDHRDPFHQSDCKACGFDQCWWAYAVSTTDRQSGPQIKRACESRSSERSPLQALSYSSLWAKISASIVCIPFGTPGAIIRCDRIWKFAICPASQ